MWVFVKQYRLLYVFLRACHLVHLVAVRDHSRSLPRCNRLFSSPPDLPTRGRHHPLAPWVPLFPWLQFFPSQRGRTAADAIIQITPLDPIKGSRRRCLAWEAGTTFAWTDGPPRSRSARSKRFVSNGTSIRVRRAVPETGSVWNKRPVQSHRGFVEKT